MPPTDQTASHAEILAGINDARAAQARAGITPASRAIAQLRHLYEQMCSGAVTDTAEAARGLLGPAIEALEATASPGSAGVRDLAGLIDEYGDNERAVGEAERSPPPVGISGAMHLRMTRGDRDLARKALDDAIAGQVPAVPSPDLRAILDRTQRNLATSVTTIDDLPTNANAFTAEDVRAIACLRAACRHGALNLERALAALTPPVATGPRVPSRAWETLGNGIAEARLLIGDGKQRLVVRLDACGARWERYDQWLVEEGTAPTVEAAQLAAESALASVATAALRAIGR